MSAQDRFDMIYRKDRLRQFHDIRNMKQEDLTRYQKMQLRDVKRQLYEFEMKQLQKAIFRTFEGPEDDREDLEIKETIVMEVII